VDFVIDVTGEVVLSPRTVDTRSLGGLVARDGRPLPVEDMEGAAGEGAVEAFERSVS
jgi:hypothetical protein